MQNPRPKTSDPQSHWLHHLRLGAQFGLITALVVVALWQADLFVRWRLSLDNAFFVPRDTTGQVVLVAVDDASLQTYGRDLVAWPRTLYADFMDIVSEGGARVVGFDVLFGEAAEGDDAFVEAITAARTGGEQRTRVVMPVVGAQRDESEAEQAISFVTNSSPNTALREVSAALGHTNVLPDPDGAVRWLPTRIDVGSQPWYAFSIATYLSYLRIPEAAFSQVITYEDDAIYVTPQRRIPIDGQGRMLINFFGNPSNNTFPTYSFHAVLAGEVDPAAFYDRIVLVGLMNQTGLGDQYFVPIGLNSERMAGVEIHANAVETLLQNKPLQAQSKRSQVIMVLLLGVVSGAIYGLLARRWYWMLLAMAILLLVWTVGVLVYFNLTYHKTNLFHALITLTLTGITIQVQHAALESRRRQRAELLRESIVRASSQRLSLKRTLPGIIEDLRQIVGVPQTEVWLWDAGTQRLQYAEEEPEQTGTAPVNVLQQALDGGQIVHQDGVLAVPLRWQDEPLGVLYAPFPGRLTATTHRTLTLFGWQTASIIANVKLYRETEELSDLKTRMIRMASHDLKNPLGVVLGYAELLLDDEDNLTPLHTKFVRTIQDSANNMNHIVQEILNLEQVRSGKRIIDNYSLIDLLKRVVEQHHSGIEQKQQTCDLHMPATFPVLVGDMVQLREAFSNLVGNASKYTPDGGHIAVRLKQDREDALIEVEDDGYGISKENQVRLFQEFYRVRAPGTEDIQGTGLGLSLVKSVIESHGGQVGVTSEEGQGSTFWVRLPLKSD